MVFSSLVFLIYFLPIFLISYSLSCAKLKNYLILVASIIFYAWGAPNFIYIAIGSILLDFVVAKSIVKFEDKRRWRITAVGVSQNLLLLLYFKYFNFFIENISLLFSNTDNPVISWEKIVLPIGLSFFAFQKISYIVDIYRNEAKPLKKVSDYTLYILLFPQLIAGPIVRYKEIATQITNRRLNDYNDRIYGIYRFSIGLGKKVLIANTLGYQADRIFRIPIENLDSSVAWFGLLYYTFQIYFDFSGYSDMAIGLGRIMGFKFPENFNSPYISQSISEFWRRWHITLGTWMREYLYIPLGGSKVDSKSRLFFNLWFVFLISGLWHGASWNFVLWGAFHGVFLILDRTLYGKIMSKIGNFFRIILTFFIVMLGWVLFRIEDIDNAFYFYKVLFSFDFGSLFHYCSPLEYRTLIISFILAFGAGIPAVYVRYNNVLNSNGSISTLLKSSISFILVILCISAIIKSDFNPFIYFRF